MIQVTARPSERAILKSSQATLLVILTITFQRKHVGILEVYIGIDIAARASYTKARVSILYVKLVRFTLQIARSPHASLT